MTNKPRANIRLRLDKGTLLLKQFGVRELSCDVMDLSEGGALCRVAFDALDPKDALSWQTILTPRRELIVEFVDPSLLSSMRLGCQIRWVKPLREGLLDFGINFVALSDEQTEHLRKVMIDVAAEKLRAKSRAGKHAKVSQAAPMAGSNLSDPSMQFLQNPFGAPRKGEPAEADIQRQSRPSAALKVKYQFLDKSGRLLDPAFQEGLASNFSEGGFRLEGAAPAAFPPHRLLTEKASVKATVMLDGEAIGSICKICFVLVGNSADSWIYGLQIQDMPPSDRKRLREEYLRKMSGHPSSD